MIDHLQNARQQLQAAQDAQQRRIDEIAQEKAALVEAEQAVAAAEKRKAAEDWHSAIAENAALHAANQQSVTDFRAALDTVLARFKELLATLPGDAVQTTFDAAQQQAQGAAGAYRRQLFADAARAGTDDHEAVPQVVLKMYEASRPMRAPWPIDSALAAWARDAADPQERRARTGIVWALYGGELTLTPDTTDQTIQDTLNAALHNRLTGRK